MSRIPTLPPVILPVATDKRPLFSVMIPVYNCIDYIQASLESVLSQGYDEESMQIEVVDDFSTDGNVEELVKNIGKGRVGYFRQQQNVGSLRNFESCLNRAKGHYIHMLHGDDKVENGFYREIKSLFDGFPQAGAAFTNFNYIDHHGANVAIKKATILHSPGIIPNFIEKIGTKQLIQPPAIVVKRSVYESVGSFFAVHFGEDWEMWARVASKYPVAYSPSNLASYRVGHGIGISYASFRAGQNVTDMKKVIGIIEHYLPASSRERIKKASMQNCANICIRIANSLLLEDRKAAFRQVSGALSLSRNPETLFRIIRFYAMHILRYKQIEKAFKNAGFIKRFR